MASSGEGGRGDSDVVGTGHGSAHTWVRGASAQVGSDQYRKCTRYTCAVCGEVFEHHYDIYWNIFEAMLRTGVPSVCRTSAATVAPSAKKRTPTRRAAAGRGRAVQPARIRRTKGGAGDPPVTATPDLDSTFLWNGLNRSGLIRKAGIVLIQRDHCAVQSGDTPDPENGGGGPCSSVERVRPSHGQPYPGFPRCRNRNPHARPAANTESLDSA